MAKIELSVNVNYLPKWGAWEGIRELVQNGKDAQTEFGAELIVSHSGSTLSVTNVGAELTKEALLFGTTSKASRTDTIGRFGEGLKLGVLALVRSGHPVTIRSGDETWMPKIERSEQYSADVLCFYTKKAAGRAGQVRVEIGNVSREAWQALTPRFLFLDEIDADECVETQHGRLLLGQRHAHQIYVKGIYVQTDAKMEYGYDLSHAEIDRDRKMVDYWSARTVMNQIWMEAVNKTPDLQDPFYKMLVDSKADLALIEHLSILPADVIESVRARFMKEHGESAVPCDSLAESADLAHLGKKGVVVGKGLAKVLDLALGTKAQRMEAMNNEITRRYGWHELSDEERESVTWACIRVANAAQVVKDSRIKTQDVMATIDVVDFRSPDLEGQHSTGRNAISKARLRDSFKTLQILIHEWCHQFGKDGDKGHVHNVEEMWMEVCRCVCTGKS